MAEPKQVAPWKWQFVLDSMARAADPILLNELGKEIHRSIESAKKATARGSGEDASDSDSLVEFECERIEGLLGMSFVACQLAISAVVSECLLLYKDDKAGGCDGLSNRPKPKKLKDCLMGRCNPTVAGKSCTQVGGINAFANHFKHVDEWASDWTTLKGLSGDTAKVVTALGAKSGSTGNLRTGFKALLGHDHFDQVSELGEIMRAWGKKVRSEYEQKLKDENLLPSA